jgi:multiple sugar transport system permease protein
METAQRVRRGRMTKGGVRILLGVFLVVALAFPYVIMLWTALKSRGDLYSIPPRILPDEWVFSNFINIWTDIPLARYLFNSLVISLGATALALACAIPAAYAIARLHFRGRRAYLFLVLTTQMFSPIVLIIGLFRMVRAFELMDTLLALILINAAFFHAFAVWILSAYFSSIPKDLEEAAWIDGASRLRTVRIILMPLALPGLITTMVFVFIQSWNEFVVALTVITSPENRPLTTGIFGFFGRHEVLWHYVFATSAVATIPVIILFLAVQRQLIGGLTAGGVKD